MGCARGACPIPAMHVARPQGLASLQSGSLALGAASWPSRWAEGSISTAPRCRDTGHLAGRCSLESQAGRPQFVKSAQHGPSWCYQHPPEHPPDAGVRGQAGAPRRGTQLHCACGSRHPAHGIAGPTLHICFGHCIQAKKFLPCPF